MKQWLFWLTAGLATAAAAAGAYAQQLEFRDDIPMDVYLDSLAQISPAAREGADRYLEAYRSRCGRSLTPRELRRAVAGGDGDPVLMGMIRAAYQKDADALRTLATSISCVRHG